MGTNGQPVFSAADKLAIRNGFAVWAEHAVTRRRRAATAPVPVNVYNDPRNCVQTMPLTAWPPIIIISAMPG